MYILKKEYQNEEGNKKFNKLLRTYNKKQKEIAKKIGIDKTYVSQVANGKSISKLCAYAICKSISSDLETENLFYII